MKKVIFILLALSFTLPVFSEGEIEASSTIDYDIHFNQNNNTHKKLELNNEFYTATVGQHFAAFGEALTSNLVLMAVNRYIRKAPYAYISWDSIHHNLTTPWVWDQDGFAVNHIGHPYQGSFYYIAGRSNNLSFWESYLVAVLGSVTWELFAETETPSYNDLIVTTIGGLSVGEMLHRLYFDAKDINDLFGFIVSPMTSINNAFYSGKLNRPNGNVTSLSSKLMFGFIIDKMLFKNSNINAPTGFTPLYLGGGVNIVYGNPYGLVTKTPYDQFELNIKFNGSKDYYNLSIFSDGMLWSFSPWEQDKLKTSMGLSLHYDFLLSSKMNYSANSLGWTIKQHAILPNNWDIKWDLHLNAIIMSASDFYFLFKEIVGQDVTVENRKYDLGTGLGFKTFVGISHPTFGSVYLYYFLDWIKTIKDSLPKYGSQGSSLIGVGSLSYEHKVYNNLSLGIEFSSYIKSAFYKDVESTYEHKKYLNIYLKYLYK